MDSKFGLVLQTASLIAGGLFALYTLKKLGWVRGLYEDENRALKLYAVISVVANVGILLVRLAL